MTVYENGKPSNTYDINNGVLEPHTMDITFTYSDGEWVITDQQGKVVDGYDGYYPEPEDSPVTEEWEYYTYRPLNAQEIAELEAVDKSNQERIEFELNAPERVKNLETGVDDSYEAIADLGVDVADHATTLDDIMEAIAELGVTIEELNNG